MNSKAAIAIFAALIGLAGVLWLEKSSEPSLATLTYTQFLEKVQTGQIAGVKIIAGSSGPVEVLCRLQDGNVVRTVLPSDYRDALAAMQDKLVSIEIQASSFEPSRLLWSAAPFLLLLALWAVLMIRKFPNGPRQNVLG